MKYLVWLIVFPINTILFIFDWLIITIVNALNIISLPMMTMEKIEESIRDLKDENS